MFIQSWAQLLSKYSVLILRPPGIHVVQCMVGATPMVTETREGDGRATHLIWEFMPYRAWSSGVKISGVRLPERSF